MNDNVIISTRNLCKFYGKDIHALENVSADIKKGDVIISVDGVSVSDVTHFRYLLYKHNIGDKIIIEYNRNGVNNQAEVWLTK